MPSENFLPIRETDKTDWPIWMSLMRTEFQDSGKGVLSFGKEVIRM